MYKIDFQRTDPYPFYRNRRYQHERTCGNPFKRRDSLYPAPTQRNLRLTKKLVSEGAHIIYGQKVENITRDIGCVVYTAAINRNNPELIEAVALKVPMLTRAELLGQLMKNYRYADRSFRNSRENND